MQVDNFSQLPCLAFRGTAIHRVRAAGAVLRAAVACLWDHPSFGPQPHEAQADEALVEFPAGCDPSMEKQELFWHPRRKVHNFAAPTPCQSLGRLLSCGCFTTQIKRIFIASLPKAGLNSLHNAVSSRKAG